MRRVMVSVLLLCLPGLAQAQVGSQLAWNQADADADLLEYRVSVDGAAPLVLNAACAISIPDPPVYACLALIPLTVPYGRHEFELIACRLSDGFEACASASVSGVFLVAPAAPSDGEVR